jgi:hypothetical protein
MARKFQGIKPDAVDQNRKHVENEVEAVAKNQKNHGEEEQN